MERLSKADFVTLAKFRAAIRSYIRFTEMGARKVGITPQQHQLLLMSLGRPGRDWIFISELAEALQLTHNTIVGLVDRCVVAGLVERKSDPSDHRKVKIIPTQRARKIMESLSEQNLKELKSLRQHLSGPLQFEIEKNDSTGHAESGESD